MAATWQSPSMFLQKPSSYSIFVIHKIYLCIKPLKLTWKFDIEHAVGHRCEQNKLQRCMEDKLSTFLHTVFPSDSAVRPAQKNNGGKRCLFWEKCKWAPSWIPAGCSLTSWQSTKKFWHWRVSNSRGILFSISNKWLFNQQERHRILIMWRCDAAAAKHWEPDQNIQKSVCLCHQSKCVKCLKVKKCIEWSSTVGLWACRKSSTERSAGRSMISALCDFCKNPSIKSNELAPGWTVPPITFSNI